MSPIHPLTLAGRSHHWHTDDTAFSVLFKDTSTRSLEEPGILKGPDDPLYLHSVLYSYISIFQVKSSISVGVFSSLPSLTARCSLASEDSQNSNEDALMNWDCWLHHSCGWRSQRKTQFTPECSKLSNSSFLICLPFIFCTVYRKQSMCQIPVISV